MCLKMHLVGQLVAGSLQDNNYRITTNNVCMTQWRHNDCLPNCLFRHRSKKTSKPRVAAFVRGIHRWPLDFRLKSLPLPWASVHWLLQCTLECHWNATGWPSVQWRLKSPASRVFTQSFIQAQIKENIKAPRHWPLSGKLTRDRWIPRTKGH